MRKALEIGGIIAAAVLIAFGIASIVMASDGQSTVKSSLEQQQIYGTPDMSPSGIKAELTAAQAQQNALFAKYKAHGMKVTPSSISAPSCSVANDFVNSGDRARCFAQYMWIHTMGATNGLTYSQMGRYVALPTAPFKATDGIGGTNDPKYAQVDAKTKQPVNNGRRDLWVTYTALTTALNASYMASQIALFGLVVGIALLLAGIGFGIFALSGAIRSTEPAFDFMKKWTSKKEKVAPTSV